MTTDRIAHHLAQFLDGVALRGNGMAEGRGDKATVDLVLTHFKEDLAHAETLTQEAHVGKANVSLQASTSHPVDGGRRC